MIKTPRLGMRRYVEADAPLVQAMFADTYAQQFYPSMNSIQSAERWISWNLSNYQSHGFGLFAIELLSTSRFVGDAGITYQIVEGEQILEVGWHIRLSHRCKGYATEAANACLNYAFGALGAVLVGSSVDPLNYASVKVASRVHVSKREYQGKSGPMLLYFTCRDQYNGNAQPCAR